MAIRQWWDAQRMGGTWHFVTCTLALCCPEVLITHFLVNPFPSKLMLQAERSGCEGSRI